MSETPPQNVHPIAPIQKRRASGRVSGLFMATIGALGLAAGGASAAGLSAYSGWNGEFYSLNLDTGEAKVIASSPAFYGLDFAPDGTLYAMSRSTDGLYTVDPVTGTSTFLRALPGDATGSGLTVSPDGQSLYFPITTPYGTSLNGYSALYRYDIGSGTIANLGILADILGLSDIDFSPDGTLYAISGISFGTHQLFTIDLATMRATPIGTTLAGSGSPNLTYDGLEFGPGEILYATLTRTGCGGTPCDYLATIDVGTGIATEVSPTVRFFKKSATGATVYVFTDTLAITPVPLPPAIIQLACACAALVGFRTRWSPCHNRGL